MNTSDLEAALASVVNTDVPLTRPANTQPSSGDPTTPPPVGGFKKDEGKAPLHLVPSEFIFALAEILGFGAKKYPYRNWERGMDWSRCYGALLRHMFSWWAGKGPTSKSFLFEDLDSETQRSHLWHAACCICFLVVYEERQIGKDDRWTGE